MSKVIPIDIGKFKGSVTLADPLTFPQATAIERALDFKVEEGKPFFTVFDKEQLPAIFAVVEKWDLTGLPEEVTLETFPASPRKPTHLLIQALFREVVAIYTGESIVPKE